MSASSSAMNVICLPSTTQNLAGTASVCLTCAMLDRVFAWLTGAGDRIRILTPFSFAFWNAFFSASDLRASPGMVVIILTDFSAFFIADAM